MAKQPSIEQLMAELGSMGYKAPSSYTGYQSGLPSQGIGYKALPKGVDWDFTADDFGSLVEDGGKKKSNLKPDLWGVLTGTLGQLGGAVTDKAYEGIGDIKGLFDDKGTLTSDLMQIAKHMNPTSTITKGAINGGKEQMKKWKDGELTWGDVPGIGFLHGMDKGWKRGQDIMEDHTNVENRWGKVGGGIAIDIALDPLTYLTGGAAAATKLSKAKELSKIKDLQKVMQVAGKFKTTDEFAEAARQSLKTKYPNLSDNIVNKRIAKVTDEIKAARAQTYNANINKWGLSVPFMNNFAEIGNIKKGNILHRTESTLGTEFQHLADDIIKAVTKTPEQQAAVTQKIQQLYGVNKLDELTKTMYDDLYKRLTPVAAKMGKALPDATVKPTNIPDFGKLDVGDDITKLLKSMDKPAKVAKNADETVDLGAYGSWGKGVDEVDAGAYGTWKADPLADVKIPKVTSPQRTVDKAKINYKDEATIFKNGQPATVAMKDRHALSKALATQSVKGKVLEKPFAEMGDFKTAFEHWLGKKNPFDARTLKTGNQFVNSMADHIADMNSAKIGETARYHMGLSVIEKFIKKNKITKEQMMEAIYHLEGQAPKSFGKDWVASDIAKQLANKIKPILDDVAENEKAAGVLDKTRKDYFPHMVQKDAEELKKIMEFKNRHGSLDGLSQANKNNKSRTSFDTLAQRDDYLMKLEKKIQKETDPTIKEQLLEQQKHVAELFDTDVVSAVTRRIREGVRAKAVKEMNGELKKFGMYKHNPTPDSTLGAGMKKLDKNEVKKLGLGEGSHYMHEEVLNGLKRIDEIFTDQGMNKVIRHMNAVSDAWRSLVTHYKISHFRNNMIGNIINNLAAGVRPSDYKMAAKLIWGYRNGKLTPAQMKLMQTAYKKNVIAGGFVTDVQHGFKFETQLGSEKVADFITNNKAAKAIRNKGEIVDDFSRLANFLGGMNKYGSVDKAAQQVRKYLFNYNELTNADRHMRTYIPFWNWTKRNIPLQVEMLMENPKVAMNVERFKDLFNEGREGEEWQKETGIKLPGTDYYTSIPSPTSDLNTLLNPMSLIGSMAPVPKMALETYMNKKMFNGQPITYGQDKVDPRDLPEYFAKNFGITGNIYDAVTGKRSAGESLINYLNPIYKVNGTD